MNFVVAVAFFATHFHSSFASENERSWGWGGGGKPTNKPRDAHRATHGAIMVRQIGYGTAGGGTRMPATMHGLVMDGMGAGMASKHLHQRERQPVSRQIHPRYR